jgi:hypothetical protein
MLLSVASCSFLYQTYIPLYLISVQKQSNVPLEYANIFLPLAFKGDMHTVLKLCTHYCFRICPHLPNSGLGPGCSAVLMVTGSFLELAILSAAG